MRADLQRLRLVAVMAVVCAPHFARVPAWIGTFASAVLLWQALAAWRGWRAPGRYLRLGLALLAFAGVYASFGRVNGLEAGVALLVAMLTLKLTETRSHRDVMVLLGLCYFLLVTHFLFSQAIFMALYLALAAWLITACFLDANHPQGPLATRAALRNGAALLAQALPVAALLFVLFPRIPGPLWGLPDDAGVSGSSGLSESMSPGSISRLALSDEVAFRVRFDGDAPPPSQRYWRGPVFWYFNGGEWRTGRAAEALAAPGEIDWRGEPKQYELTLEPHGGHWLPALDLPRRGPGRPDAGGALRAPDEVRHRRLYRAVSHTDYRLQPDAPVAYREAALQLPARGNPRARELAERWRAQVPDPAAIVDTALRRFRDEPYRYTLQPPPLRGGDRIDDFLFESRAGFCEHYAGAFTFLMRAAGIPARVVTGYLGGERNDFGDYLIVRASDAHAWTEVWLAGRGWVRVDPTGAVSPARVERGLGAALGPDERPAHLMRGGMVLRYRLEAAWDMANAYWDRWFLAYGPELQQSVLSRIGLPDLRAMILALTGSLTALLALIGAILLWRARPRAPADPAVAAWRGFCRRLARAGIERRPDEGPAAFARRAAAAQPERAAEIRRIAALYIELRYRDAGAPGTRRRLLRAVREFRPRSA
ncbi:transglutaminase domain-containing protein [Salinisphaera sp. PC39]|uniref:transglutaminase TgpA family protein n=1 Tax=Salinisphaera sp. PC39 TaxID=1304156 RepID=UPI00334076DA